MMEPGDGSTRTPNMLMRGLLLGFAAATAVMHMLLLHDRSSLLTAYREFQAPLPAITRITLTGYWYWGVPIACFIALAALSRAQPRSLIPYIASALMFAAALISTWYFPTAPFRQLAGNIAG